MRERRLIIHAGFHKSGTTALQEAFDAQSNELKAAGIIYPNIGRRAHHRVAWALSGKTWGWGKRGGEKTSIKEWEHLAKAINNSDDETILISSEFFSELDGDAIRRFVHLPLVTEQSTEFPGKFTMELEDMVSATRAAILSAL